MYHVIEVRRTFHAECGDEKTKRTTMEKVYAGTRFEAQVRPLDPTEDLIERCDLQLPSGAVYLNVRFSNIMFIDREPGCLGTNGQTDV